MCCLFSRPFGILTVYGRVGWLSRCEWLGSTTKLPYGLQGILLSSSFNMPLAMGNAITNAKASHPEQRQLFSIRHEWLATFSLSGFSLIYGDKCSHSVTDFLCSVFASFATVLALGGGPAATTVELAYLSHWL